MTGVQTCALPILAASIGCGEVVQLDTMHPFDEEDGDAAIHVLGLHVQLLCEVDAAALHLQRRSLGPQQLQRLPPNRSLALGLLIFHPRARNISQFRAAARTASEIDHQEANQDNFLAPGSSRPGIGAWAWAWGRARTPQSEPSVGIADI